MSMFNQERICLECKDKDYKKAQVKEIEQERKGNLNYKGIVNKE